MSGLPPRPKPAGYQPDCEACERRRAEGAIACYHHRTAAEWAWYAEVEAISGVRTTYPEPTLF